MTTATKTRKSVKPVRTVCLSVPPSEDNPLFIITINEGMKSDDYLVKPFPSDYGTAFQVEKIFDPEGKSYSVCLYANDTGECECLGYLRHHHCRHVKSLLALRTAGKL